MADMVPSTPNTPTGMLVNGGKAIGELAVMPGLSLVVDGEVKSGVLHGLAAVAGMALLGPVGGIFWLAVAANSYSKSVTGVGVKDHFRRRES